MDETFTQWRDSPRDSPRGCQFDGTSFVISDSDDDAVENSAREDLLIDDSSDNDAPQNSTPRSGGNSRSGNLRLSNIKRLKKNMKSNFEKNGIISDAENTTFDNTIENDDQCRTSKDLSDSDSDEDYVGKKNSESSVSSVKNKGKKRKDITHDNTREDIKELKPNSSSDDMESFRNRDAYKRYDDTGSDLSDLKDEAPRDISVTIELDSDSRSGENSGSELAAISLAKREIGVENVDPLIAQKREIIHCKLQSLQTQLALTKRIITEGNIEILPDKGEKLLENMLRQEEEIQKLTFELEDMPLVKKFNVEGTAMKKDSRSSPFVRDELSSTTTDTIDYSHFDTDTISMKDISSDFNMGKQAQATSSKKKSTKKIASLITDKSSSDQTDRSYFDIDTIPMKPTTSLKLNELGKKAQETMNKELALTVERLQDLHGSLVARPLEDEKAEDPRGLKVPLMPHQQHALAWLLWREQQKPPGGVLADDMGLGKTLTMISLIMASLKQESSLDESDDSDEEWSNKPWRYKGGTLVVCPASLLAQWEKEVHDKCKRGVLSVTVHHGSNRETAPNRLTKYDIIITTYNIVAREFKALSTLFKINWKRVILDEAHIVRNHKSQAAEAVCQLAANKRWALTGTPIQNKEMDMYSILKFLKCSPFDDLRVWKRWVDNRNAAGHQRLATVMKTLMLRRTKQELQSQGRLESLPDKFIEEVTVKLDSQEQLVYEKILIYSRTLFAQFLTQRAEKQHIFELYGGKYDKPTFMSNPTQETQFTKAQKKLLALHADVKSHEILVLLLRLRQVCCHPALIHSMLDQEDMKESGIMDTENVNPKLLRRISNISISGIENYSESAENSDEEDAGIDQRVVENLLTAQNPVFDDDRVCSKLRTLLNMVEEILQRGNDKLIIVSQWASMLDIIALKLHSIKGATFRKFTGSIAIKDRQTIIDAFNKPNSSPRILLLSLTAGGVGLNLTGGNYLLLYDIHWNPQLETQAQDRIYRFGQKKNVYIYKFICNGTIEERIKTLQERKLEIAKNVLSGVRSNAAMKLTLNDLKSLFAL